MNAIEPPSFPPVSSAPAAQIAHPDQRLAAARARLAIAFAVCSVVLLFVPGAFASSQDGDMPPFAALAITLAVLAGLALNILGAVFGVLCLRARPRSNVAIVGACLGLGSLVVPLGIAIIAALLFPSVR